MTDAARVSEIKEKLEALPQRITKENMEAVQNDILFIRQLVRLYEDNGCFVLNCSQCRPVTVKLLGKMAKAEAKLACALTIMQAMMRCWQQVMPIV